MRAGFHTARTPCRHREDWEWPVGGHLPQGRSTSLWQLILKFSGFWQASYWTPKLFFFFKKKSQFIQTNLKERLMGQEVGSVHEVLCCVSIGTRLQTLRTPITGQAQQCTSVIPAPGMQNMGNSGACWPASSPSKSSRFNDKPPRLKEQGGDQLRKITDFNFWPPYPYSHTHTLKINT